MYFFARTVGGSFLYWNSLTEKNIAGNLKVANLYKKSYKKQNLNIINIF